jgi:hypothetical protein
MGRKEIASQEKPDFNVFVKISDLHKKNPARSGVLCIQRNTGI